MIYPVLYILFILLLTTWLGRELKLRLSFRTHWRWLAGAIILGVLGYMAGHVYDTIFGNFLLHSSGGAASTLLFIYLFKTLRLSFNWRLTTLFLLGFVCTLGVLNELMEYFLETLGYGPFSFDPHDTWRDLLANTMGMLATWIIYLVATWTRTQITRTSRKD